MGCRKLDLRPAHVVDAGLLHLDPVLLDAVRGARRHLPAARHQRLGKAGWIIFAVCLPFLGIFVYLISNSKGMAERNMKAGTGCAGQHRRVHQVGGEQRRPGRDDRKGTRTAGEGRNHAGRVRAAEGRRPGRRLRTDAGGAATAAPPGRRLQLACSRRGDVLRPPRMR